MIDLAREERDRSYEHTMNWDAEQVRRSQDGKTAARPRKHPPRRKKRGSGPLYYVIILIISAILAGLAWLFCSDFLALNKQLSSAEIVVSENDKLGSVAKTLKQNGLIEYKTLFLLYGMVSDTEIAPGVYTLNTNMDYNALLSAMSPRSGVRATVDVTIPEGYNMQQTFELLASKNVNSVDELMDVAANYDFEFDFLEGKELGDASRLEGYLFPDTYQFYCGGDPEAVIKKFLQNFDKKMDDSLMEAVKNSPYTLDEIITIASLIEEERDGNDEAKISSVIRNRMKTSGETAGYLQIDASLIYALGEHTSKLTEEDKKLDSPYNLYTNKGLPPTAISNPGMTSIRAALYPENTSYYFYALGDDGVHHFFRTYREHVNFINSQKLYQ